MSKHPRDRGERRARQDKQKKKYEKFSDFLKKVQDKHQEGFHEEAEMIVPRGFRKETIYENDND